jgi:hypothetical protein
MKFTKTVPLFMVTCVLESESLLEEEKARGRLLGFSSNLPTAVLRFRRKISPI